MNFVEIINKLRNLIEKEIKIEALPSYLVQEDYVGYVIVFYDFEKQTNTNQIIIRGDIFRQIDGLEKESGFSFIGNTYRDNEDYISFHSKKVQVLGTEYNVARGLGLSAPFYSKITVEEEDDNAIKKVEININNDKIIEI